MKYIAIIALAVAALSLGGCADKPSHSAPAPASHGYSK